MINPAHVDLFRAVLRHGGMTRAAVALGIGQPHVSRAIAQLEADLGFPLLLRGHGSALPTREGEAFAREVERTWMGLDHLRDVARQIRETGAGPLRIACQPALAACLLPRAVRRLNDEHPGARVAVHLPSPDTIWSWVASGRCDLGLARPRTGFTGVTAELFLAVEAVCVLPRRHALARRRSVTVQDLAGEPLIAGMAGAFQAAVEERFAQEGLVPRFVHTAQYTLARCALVAEGLGLAVVDPMAAAALGGLPIVFRPFRPALPIVTMLLHAAERPPERLAERLVALMKAERDAPAFPGHGPTRYMR